MDYDSPEWDDLHDPGELDHEPTPWEAFWIVVGTITVLGAVIYLAVWGGLFTIIGIF
jgi:hypothetical protein